MTNRSFLLATIASLLITAPVWAHHSHGNYDMGKYLNLKGTVKEIHWINPHSWIYLEVANDKGEPDVWALEGAAVTQLSRKGWTKESVKVGDKIAVRCHQLRDGSNGCLLGFVTTQGATEEKEFD